MEVKINKEIREYQEKLFFGLSMRQSLFSALAIIIAVLIYFLLKDSLNTEILTWVCMFGAAPFGALGFIKYNNMNAEQFLWAIIKTKFLLPSKLVYQTNNIYYELLQTKDRSKKNENIKKNKGKR